MTHGPMWCTRSNLESLDASLDIVGKRLRGIQWEGESATAVTMPFCFIVWRMAAFLSSMTATNNIFFFIRRMRVSQSRNRCVHVV